jgi:hypothetical protein
LTLSKRGPRDRLGGAGGSGNLLAATPFANLFARILLDDWRTPGIYEVDLLALGVYPDYLMAVTREAGRGDNANIAEAEDCDPHNHLHRRTPASA